MGISGEDPGYEIGLITLCWQAVVSPKAAPHKMCLAVGPPLPRIVRAKDDPMFKDDFANNLGERAGVRGKSLLYCPQLNAPSITAHANGISFVETREGLKTHGMILSRWPAGHR